MTKKRKHIAIKVAGWIVGGFCSLLLLVILVFYLGRGFFMKQAVNYLNDQQPGEVQMEQMNLIPFANFPNVTLQLQKVVYYESPPDSTYLPSLPVFVINEVDVTLDIVQLIRGDFMVSEAKLKQGVIRLEIYEDSLSNLEHALGIRFGQKTEKDSTEEAVSLSIDLQRISFTDIEVRMDDPQLDKYVDFTINQLESSMRYLSKLIEVDLELNIDLNSYKYQSFNDQTHRNAILQGRVSVDTETKKVEVEPSMLSISGLELKTAGSLFYGEASMIDLSFEATNEGLEVLNYLFRGVLDLEEVEQIGSGSIWLKGDIKGSLGGSLPVIRVFGEADELGFRISSINKEVSGISFGLFASNGAAPDFSQGELRLTDFSLILPGGNIDGNISVSNLQLPKYDIEVKSLIDLGEIEDMIQSDLMHELKGVMEISGKIGGSIDPRAGDFLDQPGSLQAKFTDVGCLLQLDSVVVDSISSLNGVVSLENARLESEQLDINYNGNLLNVGFRTENLLPYFLGYAGDISVGLSISSDLLTPASFIRDTAVASLLGDQLNKLTINVSALVTKEEFDDFIVEDSIPEMELYIDSSGILLPFYADISNLSASLTIGSDTLSLNHLEGSVGESSFDFSGYVANYHAMTRNDSGEVISLDFDFSSELMRAEDFFTYNHAFLLPQTYHSEYLEDFRLAGRLEAPAAVISNDTLSLDFELGIEELGWRFHYYPLTFEHFRLQMRRKGDQIKIENLQGRVGDSNLKMAAILENFSDSLLTDFNESLLEKLEGTLELQSDLLDFNELINYQLPDELREITKTDSSDGGELPRFNELSYPSIDFAVDIGELRYEKHSIYGMKGNFRTSREKIFYLDHLEISPEGRGTLLFNGQADVSDSSAYSISAELELKGIDISDLNFELQSADTIYTLKENFQGVVDASGLAEIFITPEMKVDIATSTAMFNVKVDDGALINFTPLQAAGKVFGNKNLNHVKFATMRNSFTLTDSRLTMPLMWVESSLGLILIEGEQGLDKSYLYLLRVPPKLAMEAAVSALSENEESKEKTEEDEVSQMKRGDYLVVTLWSNGVESDYKLGDKREKFRKQDP